MKKLSLILISIISFIILYILYKFYISGFQAYFIKSNYTILIILIVFIIILIYGLKTKNNDKTNTIVLSIIFSFYLIDLFYVVKNDILKLNQNNKYRFVNKSKYQIFEDLKSKKIKSSPTLSLQLLFNEKYMINDEEKIILTMPSFTQMIHCYRDSEWIFFNSDRYGFNNKDIYWENYDTVVLGDSFGIGECVPNNQSIAGIILDSNTVNGLINLSQTGNGPLLELAIFLEYADIKKTKKLIWLYFEGNDLPELKSEKKNKILNKYLRLDNYSQNLKNNQKFIDNSIRNFVNNESKKAEEKIQEGEKINTDGLLNRTDNIKTFTNFIKLSYFRKFFNLSDYRSNLISDVDETFFEILFKVNSLLKENDGKLYFVYLPTNRDKINQIQKENFEKSRKIILEKLSNENIEIIDVYKDIYLDASSPYEIIDKKNGHYTIYGYEKIANKIINKLR